MPRKKAEQPKPKFSLWMMRNTDLGKYYLVLSRTKPNKRKDCYDGYWDTGGAGIRPCSESMELLLPKELQLKPGGGPIKVKIVEDKDGDDSTT